MRGSGCGTRDKNTVTEERIATLVTASEFLPVKMAVYGIVGTALITVLSALVAGLVGVTPHVVGR